MYILLHPSRAGWRDLTSQPTIPHVVPLQGLKDQPVRACALFPPRNSGDVKRDFGGVHALLEMRSAFWTGISSRVLFSRSSLQ